MTLNLALKKFYYKFNDINEKNIRYIIDGYLYSLNPLEYAIITNNIEEIRMLLYCGAEPKLTYFDPHAKYEYKKYFVDKLTLNFSNAILDLFLRYNANPDSFLNIAIYKDDLEMLLKLLKLGAKPTRELEKYAREKEN